MSAEQSGAWAWKERTAPFLDGEGRDPARFVFEQVGDDEFRLTEAVVFAPPEGGDHVRIDAETLVQTDFASIPLFMAWFVPVNGRHTPAAVLHDQLVVASEQAGAPPDGRAAADDTFLAAMAATGVPVLRRRLMHAAVTLATRWTDSLVARLGIVLWACASVLGTVLLARSLVVGDWLIGLAAVVAPAVGGLLWGRRSWVAGVLAGYAVWMIGLPALATAVGYAVYWLAEQVTRLVAAGGGEETVSETPGPAPYR